MVYHEPVLLQEACDFLSVQPGRRYIDATVGGGGHAAEIIRRGGQVLGLDQDADAIAEASKVEGLTVARSNFLHLQEVALAHNWQPVAGILFDLGISSHHLDTPERGFSFQQEGPLDMRMDQALPHTAATLVNEFPADQLARVLREGGEIPGAVALAEKIIGERPVETTTQLARITGKWSRQAFQALRIAVNDELGAITTALPQAIALLESGGRLVVITFHSLEDRIVKDQFKDWEQQHVARFLTDKPITPSDQEQSANPRSKSAKLRVIEKL